MSLHVSSRHQADLEAGRPALAHLPGLRLAAVLWGGLAVVDVWRATGAPSYAGLVALAVLVTVSSIRTGTLTALGSGLIGWLLMNGFVVHRAGVLRYDGHADLLRLVLLVAPAVLAARVRR